MAQYKSMFLNGYVRHKIFCYIVPLALILTLSGCQLSPQILNEYDDFKKAKICKLESFRLKFDSGFLKYRDTDISLTKVDNDTIRASILNVYNKFPCIENGAKLKFKIYANEHKYEELVFQAQNQVSSTVRNAIHTQYGTHYETSYHSTVFFNLPKNQLIKMINAQKVNFEFEAEDKPIIGTFTPSTVENFSKFIQACY